MSRGKELDSIVKSKNEKCKYLSIVKKVIFSILAGYFVLSGLFYILAGEQLHFRASKGSIVSPSVTDPTIELIQGTSVTETFTNNIQIFEGISIMFGNYNRENNGNIMVVLKDLDSGKIIINEEKSVDLIRDGQTLEFKVSDPIEGLYNHKMSISIISVDGISGQSITPLMNNKRIQENMQLYFNDTQVQGTLCFSTIGRDRVWLGLHYWKIVSAGAIMLLAWSIIAYVRFKKGNNILIINVMIAMKRYKFLIQQMVSRDFKTKYKRSILGIFWSFLNPLLSMLVQYFVFSNLFKQDIPYYHVYLLIGVVMFNFFAESCGMTLNSILGNSNLITKVYVPKYIYPLVRVISSSVNLFISLIPLFIIIICSGINLTKAIWLSIFGFLCLIIFSLGLGLFLSTSMVFFRDTQFLWSVVSMMWMYATPIFYPESIIPDNIVAVIKCNPLYYYVNFVRSCIIDGVSPEPRVYFISIMCSLGMLILGALVFKKNQDKFIFYL